MPILDRIPSVPDPVRLTTFAMAPLVEGLEPRSYRWHVPFTLNQQSEGACVWHGITHEFVAKPVPVNFTRFKLPTWAPRSGRLQQQGASAQQIAQAFAFEGYYRCRQVDEIPGENYSGTTAAGGAKTAVECKGWGEYRWTEDVWEFAVWVSRNGPACIAVDWMTGCMEPDSDNFLNLTGVVEGGHLVCVNGFSVRRRAFSIKQSWGEDHGEDGFVWMRLDDLGQLVAGNGELFGPVRRLK